MLMHAEVVLQSGRGCYISQKNSKIHKRGRLPPIVGRLCDQEDHKEIGSKDRVASTCGPHSDSFNDTSRRRRSNCSTNNFRHLAEANLKSKRPFRALPLTPEHRQLRLQWCQDRSMWNVTDWKKVVLSDESRFVLGTNDNRVQVWRRPAYDSRSTLIEMRGTLMGQRYVDDILRPHVGPFLNGLPGAIFQQDNARPHTARVAQDFLRYFQTLPCRPAPPICPL
ncbi:transposable element Tcb2 transposase [Trichonephila clavipes]|nr:transposable element Tcb2 transposase [Trichonephila clavipes]